VLTFFSSAFINRFISISWAPKFLTYLLYFSRFMAIYMRADPRSVIEILGDAMEQLILASKSPRRKEILEKLHIPYILYETEINEDLELKRSIRSLVVGVSRRKVDSVIPYFSSGLVLGVDTVVFFQNSILGKPRDKEEAKRYLTLLNGNHHEVVSGITLQDTASGTGYSSASKTTVCFARLTRAEIEWYIETGEWFDKAGAYAIQGTASLFIKRITGSYYNVMGLPVEELYRLLKRFSYFTSAGKYRPVKRL
jgi:septum formation protein